MNKKTIQIMVVAAALFGTGFVLYNGMFKNSNSNPAALTVPTDIPAGAGMAGNVGVNEPYSSQVSSSAEILPYGNTLDIKKVLQKQPLKFSVVQYPKVNTTTEVGVLEKDLVKVESSDSQAQ